MIILYIKIAKNHFRLYLCKDKQNLQKNNRFLEKRRIFANFETPFAYSESQLYILKVK